MGLILKQIFQLVKLLNSETGHNQIAAGIAAGFIIGMTPGFSLQTILVFLLALIFRIQFGAVLVSAFFFSFSSYLLDGVFHTVGYKILIHEGLKELFTTLYNLPLIPLTRFNNTIFMGAGVLAIILAPIIFVLFRFLIIKYRKAVVERIQQTKFWKAIKATSFYKWYYKYNELYG